MATAQVLRAAAFRAVAGATIAACVAVAHAAHPFITEEPGAQGAGRLELELGFAAGAANPSVGGNVAAFSPQLSIGNRANLGAFSAAFTATGAAPWQPFIEAATFSNPDPANGQWPAVARTGLIYSVNAWLDLDVGFQARLNRSASRALWLAGATLRW